jgi:transcriptional antiterminator RfaH
MGERRWYVVKTQPRREIIAAEQLQNQGFRVFFPKQVKFLRHARRVRTGFGALFPSYLFVELDVERQRWRSVNGTRGVSYLVTQAERPTPAPEGVIEDLIAASDKRGVLVEGSWLNIGREVRINQGGFVDHVAVIDRFSNADAVRVWVAGHGRDRAHRGQAGKPDRGSLMGRPARPWPRGTACGLHDNLQLAVRSSGRGGSK